MEGSKKDIETHIASKLVEKGQLGAFWGRFQILHLDIGFSEETFKEVSTKVSSRFAQIDRSIEDHEKLL